jgi:hypothetical protein
MHAVPGVRARHPLSVIGPPWAPISALPRLWDRISSLGRQCHDNWRLDDEQFVDKSPPFCKPPARLIQPGLLQNELGFLRGVLLTLQISYHQASN